MKSEHSAYIELPVYITTLNKGRSPGEEKENERKEERKEGKCRERTYDVPALSRRPGRIDGARLRVLEDRIRPSTYILSARARARIKTRAACPRFPVPRMPNAAGALSSLRGSLGSFYERSLWKQASCARDKPAVPICAHAFTRKSYGTHTCTQRRTIYAFESDALCTPTKSTQTYSNSS